MSLAAKITCCLFVCLFVSVVGWLPGHRSDQGLWFPARKQEQTLITGINEARQSSGNGQIPEELNMV